MKKWRSRKTRAVDDLKLQMSRPMDFKCKLVSHPIILQHLGSVPSDTELVTGKRQILPLTTPV
jgi:hypothetical protein